MGLAVVTFRHGPFWNFTYLVGGAGGTGVVIDPGGDVGAVVAAAAEREMRIAAAIVTHGHHDHVHGLAELVAATGAEVLVHADDRMALAREYEGVATAVDGGHEIELGDVRLQLLHTPGHTEGSLCVLAEGDLFTGDTLMAGSAGRNGAFPGSGERLRESIAWLVATLPAETRIRPGHDAGAAWVALLGSFAG